MEGPHVVEITRMHMTPELSSRTHASTLTRPGARGDGAWRVIRMLEVLEA